MSGPQQVAAAPSTSLRCLAAREPQRATTAEVLLRDEQATKRRAFGSSFGSSGILSEQLDLDDGEVASATAASAEGVGSGGVEGEATRQPPAAAPSLKRVYYLDWLRIVSIYLVFFYHCIQYLAEVQVWEEGSELRAVVTYKCFALQVGMPVFFHISGRAQALARPVGLKKTVVRRFQRLLLPFVACYILLIPLWQFVRLPTLDPENYSPNRNPEIPRHYPFWLIWFVRNKFTIDVGWLWFLPTLFLVGVFNAPLFLFGEFRARRYAATVVVSWACAAACFRVMHFSLAFVFFAALGPLVSMAVVVVVPFPSPAEIGSWSPRRWVAVQVVTWVQLAAQVGLACSFRYADMKEGPIPAAAKPLPALVLFFGLYSQGYFVQRWSVDENAAASARDVSVTDIEMIGSQGLGQGGGQRGDAAAGSGDSGEGSAAGRSADGGCRAKLRVWARLWQALLGGLLILAMSLGNNLGEYEEELFPIYSASFLGNRYFAAVHVLGTWAYIGITVPWFKAHLDAEIDPVIYKHASASTMVAYLFHSLFIVVAAYWVVMPFGLTYGLWKVFNPLLTLIVAIGASQGIYLLLLKAPTLGTLLGL